MPFISILALAAATASPAESIVGVPRSDENSKRAHQSLLAKSKAGKIAVYFQGDSILRRWGCADPFYAPLLKNWNENFSGWNAGDFGWGGDSTLNILWRIEHGEMDGVKPKVIVFLGGTNDIGGHTSEPGLAHKVIERIRRIIHLSLEKAPGAKVLLTGIFPRGDDPKALPIIREINLGLAAMEDGKTIRFIDLTAALAGPDGLPRPDLFDADRLHPRLQAYQIWADALRPQLREILGPRAKQDYAPPPTLNPELAGKS